MLIEVRVNIVGPGAGVGRVGGTGNVQYLPRTFRLAKNTLVFTLWCVSVFWAMLAMLEMLAGCGAVV